MLNVTSVGASSEISGRSSLAKGSTTMETPRALHALLLLTTTASAALWEEGLSRCSDNCPLVENPKFNYDDGKIYSYSYSVKSKMEMESGNKTETDWSSTVEMTWITPCDMAIKFKNTRIDGNEVAAAAVEPLENYPLVVALRDGRVQHVCSHPDDDIWAINIKKGVASAFQNSLPSLNRNDASQVLEETDVVGKCPTRYDTVIDDFKIIVRKVKNSKDCQKHYSSTTEMPVTWLLASFVMQESSCQQEINNGIYTTIVCRDKKIFHLPYVADIHVQAQLESRLQLQPETQASSSQTASSTQTEMFQDSLLYDHRACKKNPSLVEELDETLTHICEKTNETVGPEVASLVAKAVSLMRLVPDEAVEQTLRNIRSGQYCTDYEKLESLFLDMVTFIYESSAVKVIVDELLSDKTTGGRGTLYARALCLISQPNAYALEALKPLMESLQYLPSATLCGASMIYTYCQQNKQCQEEEPVKGITNILSKKLDEQCSPLNDEENRSATLGTLKILGNMGVISPEVSSSVIRCIENEINDTGIQAAAVQAFRNAECGYLPTERLIDMVMKSSLNTEVRIASYLAVIRCASERELERIISEMLQEEDKQVRAFILSHLVNLQESSVSYKAPLKHLLSNVILPNDVEVDITKKSRNLDMSFSAPPLGISAEIESNILYTPDSYIPRNLDMNMTTNLLGTSVNMVEIGTRLEGMEPTFEMTYGSQDYEEYDYGQDFSDYYRALRQRRSEGGISTYYSAPNPTYNGTDNATHNDTLYYYPVGTDNATHNDTLYYYYYPISDSTGYGAHDYPVFEQPKTRADAYVRVMGQEIYFASTSQDPMQIILGGIMGYVFDYGFQILGYLLNDIDGIRAVNFQAAYSLPTIQGIPLKLEGELTAIFSLSLRGFNEILKDSSEYGDILMIQPSFSVQVPGFFGYDSHLIKEGIQISNNVSGDIDFSFNVTWGKDKEIEIQLKVPDRADLLYVGSQAYFMKKITGLPEQKVLPQLDSFAHTWRPYCFKSWRHALDLEFCLDSISPDHHHMPLGGIYVFKVYTQKTNPSMEAYSLKILFKDDGSMVIQTDVIGAVRNMKTTIHPTFEDEMITLLFDTYGIDGGAWLSYREHKDQTTIEGKVKCKKNSRIEHYGFKIDLICNEKSRKESECKMKIYFSNSKSYPQASQLFSGKMNARTKGKETSLDLELKTMDALEAYGYDISFGVGADLFETQYSEVILPSRIRKFEFIWKVGLLQVVSYIRKINDSLHESLFSIQRIGQETFSIWTNHSAEGSWQEGDAAFKTYAAVKYFMHPVFEIFNVIFYGRNRTGITFEMVKSSDGSQMAEFVGFL